MRDNNAVEATSLWKIYRIQKNVSISLLGRDMECKKKNSKKKNTVTTPRSAHYLPSKVLLNKTEIREEMKWKKKKHAWI